MLPIVLTHVSVADDSGLPLLIDVNLAVTAGESVALKGRSGSGKSTLLRVIAGMHPPRGGTVQLLGVDLARQSYEEARRVKTMVGFAFESGGVLANRTIGENIRLPLDYHAGRSPMEQRARRARDAASELGIDEWFDELASEAPASVRKRAAIARALVVAPRILLLDEPHRAMNSEETERVARVVRTRRHERGMTLAMTTAREDAAPFEVDRILVLEQGQVVGGR